MYKLCNRKLTSKLVIEKVCPLFDFSHIFVFQNHVGIPMSCSIETRIFQAHQLCIIQFVDWKVLNITIMGKKESIGFLYSRFGCVCGSTTWANFANSKNLPKD